MNQEVKAHFGQSLQQLAENKRFNTVWTRGTEVERVTQSKMGVPKGEYHANVGDLPESPYFPGAFNCQLQLLFKQIPKALSYEDVLPSQEKMVQETGTTNPAEFVELFGEDALLRMLVSDMKSVLDSFSQQRQHRNKSRHNLVLRRKLNNLLDQTTITSSLKSHIKFSFDDWYAHGLSEEEREEIWFLDSDKGSPGIFDPNRAQQLELKGLNLLDSTLGHSITKGFRFEENYKFFIKWQEEYATRYGEPPEIDKHIEQEV